jgi:IPT/TIG domain
MTRARLAGMAMVGVVGALAAPVSGALAASAGSSGRPTIRSVAPMTANVGDRLTIRGRNLAAARGKRTSVVFKTGGRSVTVKARRATRTKITLVIPATLTKYLRVVDQVAQPTRFRLRVRARRTGRRFTAVARSPRIGLLSSLPGAAGIPGGLLPLPAVLDPADDCNGDGVLNELDDLVVETVDGGQSVCDAY